jgi:hypothetical protein
MMEERVKQLEMVTKRLMRRATKKASVLITPYPISNAVFGEKVEGPILRYMFPCDGIITKGFIRLGVKPKSKVMLGFKIFNESKSASRGTSLDNKTTSISPELSVTAGDCLEVSLEYMEEAKEPVTEIWISFLWRPTIKDIEAKSFLMEDIENDLRQIEMTARESLS